VALEGLKDEVPISLQLLQLDYGVPHSFSSGRSQLVYAFTSVFGCAYQTGSGEQPSMFADGGTANRKTRSQFARPARRICEAPKNLSTSWIAESGKGSIQRHD
jgi:hypothetical protein